LKVTIDPRSGFCFGVAYAIEAAERELLKDPILYCLGDIVHNDMEVNRLRQKGLKIITHEELRKLNGCRVLIRAHGEPPETYRTALLNQLELIDATCPIVLTLQNGINRSYLEMLPVNGQIVIYGREGHAEVEALKGQTNGSAIVISHEDDLRQIDFSRPVRLFSQTTKEVEGFNKIAKSIREEMEKVSGGNPVDFEWNDSICRQVSNRSADIREFAVRFDVIVFVSGQKSSNGMILYQLCKDANPQTYLVSGISDLDIAWFKGAETVGICGATSTPMWLMEEVAGIIQQIHQ
jgi:4-hydroxy-3-methylbut-2-enyl diphosphate reductase